jgi:dolichol-phosphate mannosyltransferase
MMIYFLMPAYNEETEIGARLRNIGGLMGQKGFPFEIWVVNDGSDDETVKIVEEVSKEIPVHMIHNERNQGIGIAFLNGLKELVKRVRDDDIIITLDADNTHNLKTVDRFLFYNRRDDDRRPHLTIYFKLRKQSGLPIAVPCQRNSNLYRFLSRPHRGSC